jgi:hypothetical protein
MRRPVMDTGLIRTHTRSGPSPAHGDIPSSSRRAASSSESMTSASPFATTDQPVLVSASYESASNPT